MKIQQLQPNMKFEAKRRFLEPQQYNDLRVVLEKMNSEVEYTEDESGMHFASRLVGSISADAQKYKIIDGRFYLAKVPKSQQMVIGSTDLVLDNVSLKIDNKTAEIISWEKPFFTSWTKVMKNTTKALKKFKENYANPEVVNKYPFGINGFTQKGAEVMDKIIRRVRANTAVQRFVFKKVVK